MAYKEGRKFRTSDEVKRALVEYCMASRKLTEQILSNLVNDKIEKERRCNNEH